MFPKLYLDEVEFKELGDDVTLTSTVEGHNIMAHAWGDKVRKCFVSTHSTTLPGKPSNKRRWREMLDEDGEEVGQTEVFNKTVKRKKIVESYFDAASIIDINNQMCQGGWHWKQHGEPSLGQTVLWQQFLGLWKLVHTSCTRSSTQEAVC
jgi:hypothetical protein